MMVRLPFIFLAIVTVCFALEDKTWSWTWRKAPDNPQLDRGTSTKECTNIDHKKGLLFEFDGGNAGVCLLMYGEKDCKGGYGGYGCSIYSKKSSGDILSYLVVPGEFYEDPSIISSTSIWSELMQTSTVEPSSTTSSESSTETTATTLSTSGTSQPDASSNPATTPPAENEGDGEDDSSLSGGAIAGIVIGAVAGIVIIALISYFLFRRRSKNAPSEPSSAPPFAGAKPAVKAPPSYQAEKPVVEDKSHLESPPQSAAKWGSPTSPIDSAEPEEPGPSPYTTRPPPGTSMAELSGNNQIVELDATPQPRER